MSSGYQISKILKQLKSDSNNERMHRAMFLAHSLAFNININGRDLEGVLEEHTPELKKTVTAVNEHISVDSSLALALFVKVLKIRFELMNGVTDPSIIHMAMRSESSELYLSGVESAVGSSIVDKTEFFSIQNALMEILQDKAED